MSTFSSYFEQGLIRLDGMSTLNESFEEAYPFVPAVSRNWKTSEKRLLIIVESVDRADLKDKKLLSTRKSDRGNLENPMTNLLPRLLDKAQEMESRCTQDPKDHGPETEFALAVANFNAAPSYKLEGDARKSANRAFAARCVAIIKKIRPTHVLVSGDTATKNILEHLQHPEVAHCHIKRGWVLKCELDDLNFKLTPTLDLESVYNPRSSEEDDDDDGRADKYAVADLLFFVARNIVHLLAGKHLYSLRKLVPNPRYIDTIEKFDLMLKDVDKHETISFDSETATLESIANKIYFVQFAYCEEFGYVLPIQHPESPFSKDEQTYILSRLRKFFSRRKNPKKILYINGMFDLRIIRSQLRINYVHHTFIEVTGAESLLDENIGLMTRQAKWRVDNESVSTSYQNLRNLFCYYGNDLYYTLPFSKEERSTCGMVKPDNRDLLNYCSLDVQSIFGILKMQYRRAAHTYVRPTFDSDFQPYLPFFRRHLENQMANTATGISMMEQAGSPVDVEYMKLLMSKTSPLLKEMNRLETELRDCPALHEAEKVLGVQLGRSNGGLFAGSKPQFFDFSKKAHLEVLFFEVLKLDPVLFTPTGQRSIDKNFIKQYEADVHEVALFGAYVKTQKLMSTYVKGWYKKIMSSVDCARRHILNPGFGFFTVITGRLNSFGPSLQQIPARGPTSKYIKRMFRAPKGCLNIKYDYSAQEVRQWSVLSGDEAVAASFMAGLRLRQQWIVAQSDELKARLKKEGDVHIQNCFRFFKRWVEKSDPLREAVKAIVFGVLYGKGAKTLARDLKRDAVNNAMNVIRGIKKAMKAADADVAKLKKDLQAAEKELATIENKDWVEYAQGIMNQLFEEFSDGADFLNKSADHAIEDLHVMSPFGRVRNLWRSMTGRPGVIAAARRRAQNSPTQGFSSELGSSAGVLIQKSTNDYMESFEYEPELFPLYCRAVHDCNVFCTPYEMILPHIHIMQYEATYGLTAWAEKTFDMKFTIVPEIELELGATDDNSFKWDWSLSAPVGTKCDIPSKRGDLASALSDSLFDQIKLGDITTREELVEAYKKIVAPWKDPEQREFLQENYPLLNVKGLDAQMNAFLTDFKGRIKQLMKEFDKREEAEEAA